MAIDLQNFFPIIVVLWTIWERVVEIVVVPIIDKIKILKKNKKDVVFLISIIIGILFYMVAYVHGYSFLTTMTVIPANTFDYVDLIITTAIFAGGTDFMHQIMALIDETKKEKKATIVSKEKSG